MTGSASSSPTIPVSFQLIHSLQDSDDGSVDGLRIDTVKHVQKNFWSGFNDAAGVYSIGEVFDGTTKSACSYQKVLDGVLNYPL